MTDENPMHEFFEEKIDLYELMDQTLLDKSSLNTNISGDELHDSAQNILSDGPPDTKEEQIGFVLSSLKKQAREDPEGFIQELYNSKKRDIAKRLYPYESHEIDPFKPIFKNIRDFTDTEIDVVGDWLDDLHESDDGLAHSQQYHQLVEKELGSDRKVTVDDLDSLNEGIDLYSDIMNICDAGYPMPVALYWVSLGDDPREKNPFSMGFTRGLQELEETDFEAIPNHIDTDLRHGIKHGDFVVDPKQEHVRIESGAKEYSLSDLEIAINEALLAIDVIEAMDTYVSFVDYRRNFEFLE
jgi:hypothetical protein